MIAAELSRLDAPATRAIQDRGLANVLAAASDEARNLDTIFALCYAEASVDDSLN